MYTDLSMTPAKSSNNNSHALKFFSFSFNTLFFIVGLLIIASAAYFFGFNLLRNPILGNDALNVLTYAAWMKEYFPKIPLWYPLVGGGTSFILGYPTFYPLSVVILHKVSSLNLVSSIAVLNFASVLLPAWGIFAFVFFRFRLRIAALLAGLFYLLSPISYVLISGAGFLAHAYSYIFAVPFMICYDWYLYSFLENSSSKRKFSSLLIAGVFFVLTTLAHPVSSLGFMVLFAVYSLIIGIYKDSFRGVKKALVAYILAGVFFFLLSAFWFKPFSDYTSFSNRDITFVASTETLPPIKFKGVLGLVGKKPGNEYPFPNLSIVPFVWISGLVGLVLALFKKKEKVVALGVVGLISTIFIGTYGIWVWASKVHWLLGSFLVNRYYYTSFSIILPAMAGLGVWYLVTIPFEFLEKGLKKARLWVSLPTRILFGIISAALALIFSVVGLWFLNPISGWYDNDRPWMFHYGEEDGISLNSIWSRPYPFEPCSYPEGHEKYDPYCNHPALANKDIDVSYLLLACQKIHYDESPLICKGQKPQVRTAEWQEWDSVTESWYTMSTREEVLVPTDEQDVQDFLKSCESERKSESFEDLCFSIGKDNFSKLAPSHWPKVRLPKDYQLTGLFTASFSRLDNPNYFLSQEGVRIDITPSLGTWVKEWSINNRSSIINAYTGQLVLNKSFNSFFRDTMYSKDLVKQATAVDNLAKYFGTSGIINTGNDQTEKFLKQRWQTKELKEGGSLWIPPFQTSIYSLETKPAVLVIGSTKKQAYGQVFRAAAMGGLSYDDGLLFEGREKIDDYSLKELSKFSLITLHGYSYNNKNKAYSLIKNYLEQGGKVFVDTGWQFVAEDWGEADGKEKILGIPFPVEKTYWGSVGSSLRNASLEPSYSDQVDLAAFSPLVWEGGDWNLAYANAADLSEGARAVLKVGDRVIMADRQIGKGKIVWSGMNFIAHARDSENADELRLLNNIIKNLVGEARDVGQIGVAHQREPDRLEVNLTKTAPDGSFFYFKESYYPYWKASIENSGVKKAIPIYIAGPRFMAADVSGMPAGSTLVFEFNGGLSLLIPKVVSIATLLLLLTLLVDSVFGEKLIKKLSSAFSSKSKKARTPFGNSLSNFQKSIVDDEDENY